MPLEGQSRIRPYQKLIESGRVVKRSMYHPPKHLLYAEVISHTSVPRAYQGVMTMLYFALRKKNPEDILTIMRCLQEEANRLKGQLMGKNLKSATLWKFIITERMYDAGAKLASVLYHLAKYGEVPKDVVEKLAGHDEIFLDVANKMLKAMEDKKLTIDEKRSLYNEFKKALYEYTEKWLSMPVDDAVKEWERATAKTILYKNTDLPDKESLASEVRKELRKMARSSGFVPLLKLK